MTMNQNDHDQIIDQVISLENEFNDAPGAMVGSIATSNVEDNSIGMITSDPHMTTTPTTQHHISIGDMNQSMPMMGNTTHLHHQTHQQQQSHHLQQQPCIMSVDSSNSCDLQQQQQHLSSSSEDLLNLLLEFDRDSSNLIGNPLDQDEKIGIENIRKQLMSCDVQSDQLHQQHQRHQQHDDSMAPIVDPLPCQPQTQQSRLTPTQQHQIQNQNIHQQHHQQQQRQQLVAQTAPVIPHHQQQASMTNPNISQQRHQMPQHHQRLSVDQSLLNGPYSASPVNTFVPVSTSSQSYATQQQHQNVTRINQTNSISIVNNSPSPSWQQSHQQSISPFSPQSNHQQQQPQTPQPRHLPNAAATSPQLHQQLQQQHHPLQHQRSPSQSVSPPVTTPTTTTSMSSSSTATTEPSPVVKKNPLLNAQLVNSRGPTVSSARFLTNQTNVLNQNPILNSKLSQSPFVTSNTCVTIGSPVNPNLNPQQQQSNRFIPHQQQPQSAGTNFNYDITQQQIHQHNVNQTATGHVGMYGQGSDQQQQLQGTNQLYRTTAATGLQTGATSPVGSQPSMVMGGNASPSGNLSQQVKQEIRRKVSQPKHQQHQTTSLLKQLLSDDNK